MRSTPDNLIILFEDNHLLVINKRVGDLVQGDKTGDTPLLEVAKTYIKKKYQKPGEVFLGVVHRLDRPTSGVVIFARTSKALTRLNEAFRNRQPNKIYWALVHGSPPIEQQEIVHYLIKNEKNNTSRVHDKEIKGSKMARLVYKVINQLDNYSLLHVELLTGRHHQIRAQLAALGCAIKGDIKYGAPRSNEDGGIHLHARVLVIEHPVSKEIMHFEAPVPADAMWQKAVNF